MFEDRGSAAKVHASIYFKGEENAGVNQTWGKSGEYPHPVGPDPLNYL